jgi:hypothetical protein
VPRVPLLAVVVSLALVAAGSADAPAAGPGGWDHLGTGATPTTAALNGAVRAFDTGGAGTLIAGGSFTDAGGNPNADHIAAWDGSTWSAFGTTPLNGDVFALAYSNGRVFAGGTFINAGGDQNADYLAVWDGTKWASFCNASGPAFGGGVAALKIIGSNLYIGGTFQNGAGIAAADYLVACDLNTGAASATVAADGQSTGSVYALTADASGNLYAGGTFTNMAGIPEADYVAAYDGTSWHALGSGSGTGGGAVTGIVRGLGSDGSNVFVGTDATDVAGIPKADHVAKWDGTVWSSMGSNSAGVDGWFPATTSINAITVSDSTVFAGGQFQDADGDPTADAIGSFDGNSWFPVGSNGAGQGAINGNVLALMPFGGNLVAGGSFTSAGGDTLAAYAATYPLTGAPPPLPPPVRGEAVNVVPEKGKVFVKLPGAGKPHSAAASGFVPLDTLGSQVPVGSTLDTTRGTVLLSSAANASGKAQDGHFSQGLFTVLQSRKNPLTTLKMSGAGLNACSRLPRGGAPKTAAGARKRSRSLFSNVKGRFRTRGRNSTATVRGTRFLVKDTCKGTLTKVQAGTVVVRDLALKRTKTVKAGHSYLARSLKRRR